MSHHGRVAEGAARPVYRRERARGCETTRHLSDEAEVAAATGNRDGPHPFRYGTGPFTALERLLAFVVMQQAQSAPRNQTRP